MLLFLFAGATTLLAGSAVIYQEMKNAPMGKETEKGFEMVWCNDRPETRDVSCVWKVVGDASGALPVPA